MGFPVWPSTICWFLYLPSSFYKEAVPYALLSLPFGTPLTLNVFRCFGSTDGDRQAGRKTKKRLSERRVELHPSSAFNKSSKLNNITSLLTHTWKIFLIRQPYQCWRKASVLESDVWTLPSVATEVSVAWYWTFVKVNFKQNQITMLQYSDVHSTETVFEGKHNPECMVLIFICSSFITVPPFVSRSSKSFCFWRILAV